MMVAHLTNAAQGEMSQSSPWDLWPGRGHHKGDHGRGREYDIGERSRNYSTERGGGEEALSEGKQPTT